MRKTIYSILLSVFSVCTYGQSGFEGVVIDNEKVPVVGAIVTITDEQSSAILHTTSTDSIGKYLIRNYPDSFRLDITAFGHEACSVKITGVEIGMQPLITALTPIALAEVVVKAYAKPRMKRDGNKLVIDKIGNSPYAQSNNVFTFLRYIPVLRVPVFEGDITVVGGGTVSLQINGRRTNMPMEAVLKSIPAEDIERIEIIANPGSEYSGSKHQSIINVVMKRRPNEGFKYALFLADAHSGTNRQNGSFNLSYSARKTYITSGFFVNNQRYKNDSKEEYRYYDEGLVSSIDSRTKEKNLSTSAFFNLDYELNKKNTFGLRVSTSGNNIRTTNRTETNYGKLSAGDIDSTYLSENKRTSPFAFTRINTNLNYSLKTDSKGSLFFADLDYVASCPQGEVKSVFDKQTTSGLTREHDFIQKEHTDIDAFGAWTRYNHVFDVKNRLNSGLIFSRAKTNNDYFYGNFSEGEYQNDPNRSSRLDYDDYTVAAYTSFQRTWSEKVTTIIGLRMEYYRAKGTQKSTDEDISRRSTDLFPSLIMNYAPSDNHDFSVNLSRSVSRPRYNDLNPFKTYLSPTMYTKGNPDLKANKMLRAGLSYTLFDDYSFDLFALSVRDISALFHVPDENNLIMITNINYGKTLCILPSFSVGKRLFKGYLYLSGELDFSYNKFTGRAEGIDIDIKKWTPAYAISSDIVLSKKMALSTYARYSYDGTTKGANSFYPSEQNIELSLTKKFRNSNLTCGFKKKLAEKSKQYYETPGYGYSISKKSYWHWHASYSVTFGNNRVRHIFNRENSEISGRMQ